MPKIHFSIQLRRDETLRLRTEKMPIPNFMEFFGKKNAAQAKFKIADTGQNLGDPNSPRAARAAARDSARGRADAEAAARNGASGSPALARSWSMEALNGQDTVPEPKKAVMIDKPEASVQNLSNGSVLTRRRQYPTSPSDGCVPQCPASELKSEFIRKVRITWAPCRPVPTMITMICISPLR